jgi:hypothetical protein
MRSFQNSKWLPASASTGEAKNAREKFWDTQTTQTTQDTQPSVTLARSRRDPRVSAADRTLC